MCWEVKYHNLSGNFLDVILSPTCRMESSLFSPLNPAMPLQEQKSLSMAVKSGLLKLVSYENILFYKLKIKRHNPQLINNHSPAMRSYTNNDFIITTPQHSDKC